MAPLTAWVIAEAVSRSDRWAEGGRRLSVAVNLSAHQLQDRQLPDSIAEAQIPIAKVYHLADVREAYQDLARRHIRGKIVLIP